MTTPASTVSDLRPHERELLRVIACITARVVNRMVSGEFT